MTGYEQPTEVVPPPPLDRECAAVLANMPPFPTLALETLKDVRQPPPGYEPPSDAVLSQGGAFIIEERFIPGGTGADISVVICTPAGAAAPRPALYLVHGGGMVSGTARQSMPGYMHLAEALGLVIVAVEYRLAPETPYPGPVEDCAAGLKWTFENSEELGVDGNRVIVLGQSAGGGLAASLILLARDHGHRMPLGLMLTAPMLDDRNNTVSAWQMEGIDTWDRARNEVGWAALLGSRRGTPDVSPYAAPARASDLNGLPPTFLDVGSAETFRDEVVAFASKIWKSGGQAELHVWPGGFHGYELLAPEAAISRETRAAREAWVRRLL
ncbi:alpha/beta hydrolase [Paenarthrobacter nitroguajacolicus]|uniref:alpha/beta hydrolase n=1 Tax=Paenarthrobacter nitroguajacolicus TaxID=211146 RepID=UPI00285748A5|nr:alpha/beta hydrolase [Paenarthrobacter nitroguajacolicus]MDR6639476.1 acetyl esterase/lipase [Paenarthrobacter nitroguajacolicus]